MLKKLSGVKVVPIFLRLSIAFAFLSAAGDRFGLWPVKQSVWGNWAAFLEYTSQLNPWFPDGLIPLIALMVTILEIGLGIMLILGFKTRWIALLSGFLLLAFAFAMTLTSGIKAPLDYSVYTASAAAFALYYLSD